MTTQPVAHGAWRGRRPDGGLAAEPEGEQPTPPAVVAASITDLVSLILLLAGALAGAIGMTALLGWPGLLIAFWVTVVPVALILGNGE